MTGSKNSDEHENTSPSKGDSGDESEDESDVLEESPCGRWQKRREEVSFLPTHWLDGYQFVIAYTFRLKLAVFILCLEVYAVCSCPCS